MIVDCAVYEEGKRLGGPPLSLEEAWERCQGSRAFVWLGLSEPTPDEFERVQRAFHLHELAAEDAIHAHQRPKLEVYGDSLFIVLKPVRYVDSESLLELGEIQLFVGRNFLVSVRHGAASALGGARQTIEGRPDLLAEGPAAGLYAILDRVVDDYRTVVTELERHVNDVESEVLAPNPAGSAERIYTLRREVLEFYMATAPFVDPLDRLQRGTQPPVGPGIVPYMRDVHDHMLRVVADLHRYRELLTNAMDLYLSGASARLNVTMKQLTLIASLFLPLTFLTGFFGMNFAFLVAKLGTSQAFYGALGLMAIAFGLQLLIFKRRGIL